MTDALVYMFATIYFWAGVKNWIYFALIGQFLAIFSAIACYFLPESPRYLLATKRYAALILILEKMAKFNGIDLEIEPNYFETSHENKEKINNTDLEIPYKLNDSEERQ